MGPHVPAVAKKRSWQTIVPGYPGPVPDNRGQESGKDSSPPAFKGDYLPLFRSAALLLTGKKRLQLADQAGNDIVF